jgi:hypothetical protein
MTDEWGKILQKMAVPYSRYNPDICLEGLSKSMRTVRVAGVQHLQDTRLEPYL